MKSGTAPAPPIGKLFHQYVRFFNGPLNLLPITAWEPGSIEGGLVIEWAERAFGRKDPPQVVSDEVAGLLLSVLLLPEPRVGCAWVSLAAGFLLFRLFDIWKPPPLRDWQRLPGGWGILLDDLGAGLLANACLQALLRFPLRDLLVSRAV